MNDATTILERDLVERTDVPENVKQLLGVLPGREQRALDPADGSVGRPVVGAEGTGDASTEPYRPPWAKFGELTSSEYFRVGETEFAALSVHEEPNPLLYPMCTVGIVFNSNGMRGSGVLVGPNLMMTAGHVAPWGASNWSMEFIPAYNSGARPLGSSYVEAFWGYHTPGEASGYDYVICKLYNPLGRALGWMGSASYGDEDTYYNTRFVSSGYPGSYGTRPAVELDMGVRDIDNDDPGKELEFALRPDLGPGWSGGPLWHHTADPYIVGVLSGEETDELDPRRLVYSGGRGLVDLVRYGLTNWPG